MRMQSFLWKPKIWRVGLILLASLISIAAGASALFFGSPLSPLIVGGVVVTAAVGIVCLQNPTWALYAVIFLSFLPRQLQRLLPNFTILFVLFFALLYWLLNVAFQRRRIVWGITITLMGCFLFWGVVPLFWAPDLILGRRKLVAYAMDFLLLLLLVNGINSPKTLDGLMRTLALSGWVLVLFGAGTVLSGGYEPGTRLQVLEINENSYGISILVTMIGVL